MLRAPERQVAARAGRDLVLCTGDSLVFSQMESISKFVIWFTFLEGGSYDQIYILKYLLWPHKYGLQITKEKTGYREAVPSVPMTDDGQLA